MKLIHTVILLLLSFFGQACSQKTLDSLYIGDTCIHVGERKDIYTKDSTVRNEYFYLGFGQALINKYQNDSLILVQHFQKDSSGKIEPHGSCAQYRNGKILFLYNFEYGKITGYNFEFYPNGLIKRESVFLNDMSNGSYKEYYQNGKTKAIGYMENGVPIGRWNYFFPSGVLKKSGTYLVIHLDSKNQSKYIGFIDEWRNDYLSLKDGEWYYYFENGKLSETKTYIEGVEKNK